MNLSQAAYTLSININNCHAEIWCNDVIIFEYKSVSTQKKNISISVPLNHVILKPCEFNIRATITPRFRQESFEKDSFVRLQLFVLDYLNPKKTKTKLFDLKTPESSDIPEKNTIELPSVTKGIEGLPYYEISGIFKDKILPFNEIGWINSVDLNEYDSKLLLMELFESYNTVYTMLVNKNAEAFLNMNAEKDNLMAVTYYLKSDEIKHHRNKIKNVIQNDELELIPFDISNIESVIMGKGNVAKLRRKNGLPLIIFNDPKNGGTIKLDLKFHKKNATSKFSII
ncbi:hypothetical protein [Aquimarina longa]|uniref:hypothetical protein n=1 Tax=Aquimarina longa TaxID=1080221 RepID=UPI000785D21F|nr:hypothetical protein [Aquimarina longa]